MNPQAPLLEVEDLRTEFIAGGHRVRAVDGLSFTLGSGEILGLVGESGCGKSMTALSVLRLVDGSPGVCGGAIRLNGRDLLSLGEEEMRGVRGGEIGMIFQEPMTSLNPVLTIGRQLTEAIRLGGVSKAEAERRILAMDGQALVVRTAAFFSPDDPYNFAALVTRSLTAGRAVPAAHDRVITPTYVPHLCHAALDLMIDGEVGLWHLSNGDAVSWAEFGAMVADAVGLDSRLVRPAPATELGWIAERPLQAALGSERGVRLPTLSKAMEHYGAAIAESAALVGLRGDHAGPTEIDCVA